MARLQILELPEGNSDDRPPFILVVDQANEATIDSLKRQAAIPDQPMAYHPVAEQIGARAVFVFEETIAIPANEVPLDENGQPLFLKVHVEGEFTKLRGQAKEEIARVQDEILDRRQAILDTQRLADERTDVARDMHRLANHKAALLDALGMDRTRDWDDIRNAAAGLRKQRDAQAEASERVRRIHKPVIYKGEEICWECSAYDFVGQTTDNSPVAYAQCAALRALDGDTERSPEE